MSDLMMSEILGPGPELDEKVPVAKQPTVETTDFTAQDYIDHVKFMQIISVRASEPIRRKWDQAWGLYNNAYDFANKAAWQSKNFIPRINMTVRAATFIVKRALLGPAKPYTVDGYGDFGKMIAYYIDKLAMWHLEEANYITSLTDSLHAGMLSSLMVLKVYPVYVNEDSIYFKSPTSLPTLLVNTPIEARKYKKLKIRIDVIDPYKIHLDPTGQNKFKIQDIEMDLYDLVTLAEDKSNGFDKAEVAKIQESFTAQMADTTTSTEEDRSGNMPGSNNERRARTVFVQEYWGDVWSTDGKLVARNVTFAIANKKYLIKKPVYNKSPDGCDPYVVSPVIRKPFSVWHQGFAEVVGGLQMMMTELANLMMDANLFASAKAFEVDIDQVYDPLEFTQGIVPGKTFKKRGGGFSTAPMIREIQIGTIAQQSLPIYQQVDREFQNGIGLNEFAMPAGRSSGSRTTATEVLEKSQSATTFMEEVAKTVEENVMEPLLNKIFHYVTEYLVSFDDPLILELFGSDLASRLAVFMRNKAFRDAMHKAPIKFKARGLSASVGKLRELEKLAQLSKIIGPYPELQKKIDPDKVMRKAMEAMGWYPQDILVDMSPNSEMAPVPNFMSGTMPQTPINSVGSLGFLGESADNGMQQVPQLMNSMGG